VQSIGRSTQAGINVDLSLTPRRGMFGSLRYGYAPSRNDADDALTPPPTGTFETEWASARGESRHRFNWNFGGQVGPPKWGLTASMNGRLNSATPYNVTTGRDENGDAIFNDRPAGEERNSRRGAMTTQTDTRLSWMIIGRPINASAPFNAQRGPGGGGPRGPAGPGARQGGAAQRQQGKRLEMFVSAQNVFNRVNYTNFVGVLTSPFYGRATSAQAARRAELGWRFSF
jgi:hypothetical protein